MNRTRRPGLVSWLALGSSPCSDPRKTELLLEHARAGHLGAREELRWLYRPKLIRILRARTPVSWCKPRRVRVLADRVLDRGLRSLDGFEYTGTASFWPHLRAISRRVLLRLYRSGVCPAPSSAEISLPGSALAHELERDALERYLVLTAGWWARKAVLLRLDLGLSLGQVAAECGCRSPEVARRAIENTLLATLSVMTWHTDGCASRHQLAGLISTAVDEASPSSIPRLLSHPCLQSTRRVWDLESSWLSIPAMLSFRLSSMVRGALR